MAFARIHDKNLPLLHREKEIHELKSVNRDFVEASNKLKFRIERLEFERRGEYIEETDLLQNSNDYAENQNQETQNDLSPDNRVYEFYIRDDYCDIVRKNLITLVATGLGELAKPCIDE